jgi:hypothetical protein
MARETRKIRFDGGLNTADDRSELQGGQLQQATGIWYPEGVGAFVEKIGGRALFANVLYTTSAPVYQGLYLAQFDTVTDYLINLQNYSDGKVAYAVSLPGSAYPQTQALGVLPHGLSTFGTTLSGAHMNDNHFLCTGYDFNRVFYSDVTAGIMGMLEPAGFPSAPVPANVAGATGRPTATNAASTFSNLTLAYDTDVATYSYGTVRVRETSDGSDPSTKTIWLKTFGASAAANRRIYTTFRVVSGGDKVTDDSSGIGKGGKGRGGWKVHVVVTLSQDSGSTFPTTLLDEYYDKDFSDALTVSSATLTGNSSAVELKIVATATSGRSPVTVRSYDTVIKTGGDIAAFTPTTGFYYAYTEYDATHNKESVPSASYGPVTTSPMTQVTVTLPTTPENSSATHWRIYRTTDGGTNPQGLGLIATSPVSVTTYVDTFTTLPSTAASPLVRMLSVTKGDGTLRFPADYPPPAFMHISAWRGFLIGIPPQSRALHYSMQGQPESWPQVYVITKFPLAEHDTLVATKGCGDTLIIAATGAILATEQLPEVVDGIFNAGDIRRIGTVPGCVSSLAIAALSIHGESRVAWVAVDGIWLTNGVTATKITTNLDWNNTVTVANLSTSVLFYDRKRRVLIFSYDSSNAGNNNRFLFIHMADGHVGQDGKPDITGPHYGRIGSMAQGESYGTDYLFSTDPTTGKIYIENIGTTDAQQSYSSTQVPLIIKSPRIYNEDKAYWDVTVANLQHTDFGGSETAAVAWTTGTDENGNTQTVNKTPTLVGHKGTDFLVDRAGEWHEFTITHTGSANGQIGMVKIQAEDGDTAGRVGLT